MFSALSKNTVLKTLYLLIFIHLFYLPFYHSLKLLIIESNDVIFFLYMMVKFACVKLNVFRSLFSGTPHS